VEEFDANVSLIFVPAPFAADAIIEAADAGVSTAICITEGIPTLDMVKAKAYLEQSATRLIGPNCPGVISVSERARAGIMPVDVYSEGNVGVISRSGTLVYETVDQLTRIGIGQSSSVGVGGDPIIGTSQREALELFEADPDTHAIAIYSEPGGRMEAELAEWVKENNSRLPIVAFMAGRFMDEMPGMRFGHAGTIVEGKADTTADKIERMRQSGIEVAERIEEIPALIQQKLGEA